MDTSNLFRLKARDFFDGLISAILAGGLMALVGIAKTDFSLFSADWPAIGQSVANGAFMAFVGYLGNIFLSDKQGKILGRF